MSINRQQLHELVDLVDVSELEVLFHLLTKFIPEDIPTQEEIEAIQKGREEIARGEYVDESQIDWD